MAKPTATKPTTAVTQDEALKKAKAIVQEVTGASATGASAPEGKGSAKEGTLPPMPRPAWIRYYDHWCKVKSPYRKGFLKAYDYFEIGMMKRYVDSDDRFVDMVNLHPDTCAVIYPDEVGKIQVLHHLTVSCYGRTIVVGVNGFGSTSEVKAVNITAMSEQMDIGLLDSEAIVPTLQDCVTQNLKELSPKSTGGGEEEKLGDFFKGYPSAYMVHPVWLPLMQNAVGKEPSEAVVEIIREMNRRFGAKEPGFTDLDTIEEYYNEAYILFVYLWACQKRYFSMSYRGMFKTFDAPEFKSIQNGIVKKILSDPSGDEKKNIRAKRPSRNSPSPSPSGSGGGSDSDDSSHHPRKSPRDEDQRSGGRPAERRTAGRRKSGPSSDEGSTSDEDNNTRRRSVGRDRSRSESRRRRSASRSRNRSEGRSRSRSRSRSEDDLIRLGVGLGVGLGDIQYGIGWMQLPNGNKETT